MAKSNQQHKQNIWRVTSVTLVILLLAGVLFFLEKTQKINFIGVDPSETASTTEEEATQEEKEEEARANANSKEQLINKDTDNQQTPESTSQSIELSARQEPNNTVTIFTKLYGYSSGNCELNVTNGDKKHSQIATIVFQREYSTCAGFSIPISALSKGQWTIQLRTIDSEGTSKDKTFSYEVK